MHWLESRFEIIFYNISFLLLGLTLEKILGPFTLALTANSNKRPPINNYTHRFCGLSGRGLWPRDSTGGDSQILVAICGGWV